MTEIAKIIAIGLWAASEGEKPGSEWPETTSESARRFWGSYADEALAALDAAGFVVVPKEATEAMNTAGNFIGDYPWDGKKPSRIYAAMLAARPKP